MWSVLIVFQKNKRKEKDIPNSSDYTRSRIKISGVSGEYKHYTGKVITSKQIRLDCKCVKGILHSFTYS